MNMLLRRNAWMIVALLGAVLVGESSATVIPIAYWRLGEDDIGTVVDGGLGNTTTRDSVGAFHLDNRVQSPTYSSMVSPAANYSTGSNWSMRFDGALGSGVNDDGYYRLTGAGSAIDNFGIEAFVKSETTGTATKLMLHNGNSASDGWGLIQYDGNWAGLFGARSIAKSSIQVTTDWVHFALVRDNGLTRLFINGVEDLNLTYPVVGGPLTTPIAPTAVSMGLDFSNNRFTGWLDEARVFTFAPGQFQESDLLYQVPEPSTEAMLVIAGGIALPVMWRRRRRG